MSYYYDYYIGYKYKDKIYPLGPFDAFGKMHPVLSRSHSFASDLHYEFWDVPKEMQSEELKKQFRYANEEDDDDAYHAPIKYLKVDQLPDSDYIKRGYFLIEDIDMYENHKDDLDFDIDNIFYDHLTPVAYIGLLHSDPKKASKYMYYAYPDTLSKEYECSLLREGLYTFEFAISHLKDKDTKEEAEFVYLETEG